MPIQSVGTKKISLTKKNQHRFDEKSSNTIETNNTRDNNKKRSYPTEKEVDDDNNSENDADDTLDKFEDEQRGTAKNRRQPKGMYNMITSGGAGTRVFDPNPTIFGPPDFSRSGRYPTLPEPDFF